MNNNYEPAQIDSDIRDAAIQALNNFMGDFIAHDDIEAGSAVYLYVGVLRIMLIQRCGLDPMEATQLIREITEDLDKKFALTHPSVDQLAN